MRGEAAPQMKAGAVADLFVQNQPAGTEKRSFVNQAVHSVVGVVWSGESNTRNELENYTSQLVTAIPLFVGGGRGMVASSIMFGLNQAKVGDSTEHQIEDFGLGALKGAGTKAVFDHFGAKKDWNFAAKGVAMGASSRGIDVALTRETWFDQNGAFQPMAGARSTTFSMFHPAALATDVVTFGAAHYGMKFGNVLSKGAIEASPLLQNALTGTTFGFTSGALGEVQRQLTDPNASFDPLMILARGGASAATMTLAGAAGFKLTDRDSRPVVQPKTEPFTALDGFTARVSRIRSLLGGTEVGGNGTDLTSPRTTPDVIGTSHPTPAEPLYDIVGLETTTSVAAEAKARGTSQPSTTPEVTRVETPQSSTTAEVARVETPQPSTTPEVTRVETPQPSTREAAPVETPKASTPEAKPEAARSSAPEARTVKGLAEVNRAIDQLPDDVAGPMREFLNVKPGSKQFKARLKLMEDVLSLPPEIRSSNDLSGIDQVFRSGLASLVPSSVKSGLEVASEHMRKIQQSERLELRREQRSQRQEDLIREQLADLPPQPECDSLEEFLQHHQIEQRTSAKQRIDLDLAAQLVREHSGPEQELAVLNGNRPIAMLGAGGETLVLLMEKPIGETGHRVLKITFTEWQPEYGDRKMADGRTLDAKCNLLTSDPIGDRATGQAMFYTQEVLDTNVGPADLVQFNIDLANSGYFWVDHDTAKSKQVGVDSTGRLVLLDYGAVSALKEGSY